jgi:hypothetical protein
MHTRSAHHAPNVPRVIVEEDHFLKAAANEISNKYQTPETTQA